MAVMSATGKMRLAADVKAGDVVDPGSGPTTRGLLRAFAEIARPDDLAEVHSLAPWWIAQTKPSGERLACETLPRFGFEAWYPSRRVVSPVPQRKLPSKTRHKRRHEAKVSIEPIYPGYVFLRRLFGDFDVMRLWEVDGCGGICIDPEPAFGYRCRSATKVDLFDNGAPPPSPYALVTFPDHVIELMRVIEAKGINDEYRGVAPGKAFGANLRFDAAAMKQWSSTGRIIGKLDESNQTSLFIARLDRIVRVTRIAVAPPPSAPAGVPR